ncbi:hypothetical protein BN159_3735 [Streptomyces davaonensis JCM 4913]|uniref:Uncharacterized protein n=1 Tax=Streptomyces davaonensis (strain DSM 101723 / JCM 4913 / KCC S-0913 / 768) TaxID=1214101 RepID=K4R5X5_STRDJ|nr:DUF1707 and DUF4190 domain-containing protein [Streptomyces davaonensis]CCK28114.1 hypothetical protein BN159_3735 [Streptomyces davaonensis JCM 4913]
MTQPSWQPWQGGAVPQPWAGHSGVPSMLASHADRERAVDVLRAGFGEGRLEQPEFEKRVARAYAARTVGELGLLVADLPNGPVAHGSGPYIAVSHPFLAVPRPRTNGKAVGSAVCGLLCLVSFGLTGIPAVVLGHSARAEMQRTGEGGDGLALTGLVLGWLSTAGWAAVLVIATIAGIVSG